MLSDQDLAYARSYQAARARRCEEHDGLFLPLELLTDRMSGAAHLSVSFSGSLSHDVYVTKAAALIRAVRVTTRWIVFPWTVAKVYDEAGFLEQFSGLLDSATVEGEPYWVFRKENASRLKALIASLPLGEEFRDEYQHDYLPEPES